MGSRSPGGAYSYVTNWLKEQAKEPLKYPEGVVKSVFDNSQKVGKTYLISGTNTVPTSVITSHLWITLEKDSNLQNDQKYRPEEWMWKDVDENVKIELKKSLTQSTENFRKTRDGFITTILEKVYCEHKKNPQDAIDAEILAETKSNNQKECITCGCEADISHRYCRNCGDSVVKNAFQPEDSNPVTLDPYSSFCDYRSSLPKTSFQAGEPDFVNPNSYENIIQVIQAIGIRAGIKQYGEGTRMWLLVECDGLPYNIIRDIIANVWRCSHCSKCYYGSYQNHKCQSINRRREFGWLVPVSGLLHLEMNVARSYIKLNWDVFISRIAGILGFSTPKSQEYLRKGKDHHKLWHFLEILYISASIGCRIYT